MSEQVSEYRIDFSQIDWEDIMPGLRQKTKEYDGKRIRLAEFSKGFLEEEWCIKEHHGYVLEGSISIQFEQNLIEFQKGQGIVIDAGNKHRVVIKPGQSAILFLLE